MHKYNSPSLTDWLVISLRWLTILGLTVSLSLHGSLGNAPILLLLGLAAWNIAMTLMAGADRCRPRHRRMSVILDLAVVLALFWQQGGFSGPAYWAGLLPIFTAVVSFQIGSALIIALLVSLAEVGLAWLLMPSLTALLMAGIAAIVLLIIALLLGFLGRGLTKSRPPVQPEAPQKVKKGVEGERLRAIYNLISTLTATLNYKRVIDSALDLSLSAL
ncbi:MAG: hypothetical protein Q7U34_01915, partial [Anaerolineales bacterium]|nr:hypothetical protein [Anaerolineales bacterium]